MICGKTTPRFAAKWLAFCRKMHRVLPQITRRFAAKRRTFCRKLQIEVWLMEKQELPRCAKL